jgi:hypothetical protein
MAFRPNDGAPNPQWLNPFVSSTFVTVSEVLSDGNDGIVLVGSADRTATLLRIRTLDGSPDSGFGNNGVLSVPLRSAQRPMGDSENQVARPLVDQANGIQRVPVIFESDDADPFLEQSKELTFAWFDTT